MMIRPNMMRVASAAAFMMALLACGGENAGHMKKRTGAIMKKMNRAIDTGTLIDGLITRTPKGNNVVVGARG